MRGISLLVLIALAACGDRASERAAARDDGCAWPEGVDTAGWRVVDAGPFVLKVPPGFAERVVTGVDSYVGTFVSGDRAVAFDYGPRSTDPRTRDNAAPSAEGWSCETLVGGRWAVVRSGERQVEAGPGRTARHQVAEGWWKGSDGNHLLVIGWGPAADSVTRRQALAVVRSVKFRTVATARDSVRQLHRFCATLRAQAERDTTYRRSWEEWRPTCPSGPPPPPPDYESVR